MEDSSTDKENYPKIGNYEFLSVLGNGGMGVVCKYRSATLNKFAAVKMITNKELSDVSMMRFQREGQAAARLQHPGIVGIHDLGVTEHGDPYMIMDYFEGETVDQLLARKYQFSMKQLETIFFQCAEAMQHAHSQGVLHRDLKPSNIMVTNLKSDQIVIKILDFGIAKILDESGEFTTTTGMNIGSPLYMSPEQSQGSPLDARADIYSLGCVFYAILVGEPPFKGKNSLDLSLQHQKEKPLPISQIPHLKNLAVMGDTIMAMLEKDPKKRPQTMKEVCSRLRKGSQTNEKRVDDTIQISKRAALATVGAIALIVFGGTKMMYSRPDAAAIAPHSSSLKLQDQDLFASEKTQDPLALFTEANLGKEAIDFTARTLTDKSLLILQSDRRLVDLNLSGTGISDEGVKNIADLPLLTTLDISNNLKITDAGLKHLTSLPKLHSLTIGVTKITDQGMTAVGKLTDIEVLDLEQTSITDVGMHSITNLKKLKRLNLSKTGITDETMRLVPYWPKIIQLTLQHDSISDKGVAYIQKGAPQLEVLVVHNTGITDKGAPFIARLRNLKVLDLPAAFDDEGFAIISQLPKLETLKITAHNTDKIYDYLKNQNHLKKLVIRGQMLKDSPSAKAFKAAHPECKLERESEINGGAIRLQPGDLKAITPPLN